MSIHLIKILCLITIPIFIFLSADKGLSDHNIEISFLNTTEGDAIFIKSNAAQLLIDTGPPVIQKVILDKVKDKDLSIIISHPHPDHYGGLFYLQAIAQIKNIFDNGDSLSKMQEGSEYAAWYDAIIRSHKNYKALKKGDVPYSDADLKVEVLWPPFISDDRDYNENSLVLLVTAFKKKILLMGDAPLTIERIMLKENLLPNSVDVLKIGHHGAEDVASEEFLVKLSPRFTLITGSGNPRHKYHHPETLKRLEKYAGIVFSTHHSGNIIYSADSNGQDSISAK